MAYANILTLYNSTAGNTAAVIKILSDANFKNILVGNTFFIELPDEQSAADLVTPVKALGVSFTFVHIDDPVGCYMASDEGMDAATKDSISKIIKQGN